MATISWLFFWNLNEPVDFAELLDRADFIIVSKNDEELVATIRAHPNYREQKILLYINGMGGHDPSGPGIYADGQINLAQFTAALTGVTYKNNNFLWNGPNEPSSGASPDIVRWRDNVEDTDSANWMVRYASGPDAGDYIRSAPSFPDNMYFAFDHPGVEGFIAARVASWVFPGADDNDINYDGMAGDNYDTLFDAQTNSAVDTDRWGAGDGVVYWNALKGFMGFMKTLMNSYTGVRGEPGEWFINAQGYSRTDAENLRWIDLHIKTNGDKRVDGGMIEGFGIQSSRTKPTTNQWNRQRNAVQHAAAFGIRLAVVIRYVDPEVINSDPGSLDYELVEYALHSALLFAGALTHIRVTEDYADLEPWLDIFDELNDLGHPTGPAVLSSGTWTRPFWGGELSANPTTQTSSVTYTTPVGTNPPFVSDLLDRTSEGGTPVYYHCTARPNVEGAAITWSATGLPTGLSINTSTGLISGTPTVAGTFAVTVTASEAGGTTRDTSFDWSVTGGALVEAINVGGTAIVTSEGTFEQDDASVPHPTLTVNGSSPTSNVNVPTMNSTVPTYYTTTMMRFFRFDNASPFFFYTIPASANCDVTLGWNSLADSLLRIVDVYINDVLVDTFDIRVQAGNADHTAFCKTYGNIAPSSGNIKIEVRRSALSVSSARLFTVEVRETIVVNEAPDLTVPGDQSVNENVEIEFEVEATDANGTPVLSASGVPFSRGAVFVDNEDGTGTFTWTPDYDDAGVYVVTFVATDADDDELTTTDTVNLTVNNVNRAPVLAAIGNKSVNEGASLQIDLSATDPDGATPSYTVQDLPGFCTFEDFEDGTARIVASPDYTQSGVYDITVIVSDGSLTDQETFQLTVNNVNRAPILSDIGNKTVVEELGYSYLLTAVDPDGVTPIFSIEDEPAWVVLTDNEDGTASLEVNPPEGSAGEYAITITVSDGSLTDEETITITVILPPVPEAPTAASLVVLTRRRIRIRLE